MLTLHGDAVNNLLIYVCNSSLQTRVFLYRVNFTAAAIPQNHLKTNQQTGGKPPSAIRLLIVALGLFLKAL